MSKFGCSVTQPHRAGPVDAELSLAVPVSDPEVPTLSVVESGSPDVTVVSSAVDVALDDEEGVACPEEGSACPDDVVGCPPVFVATADPHAVTNETLINMLRIMGSECTVR
ncbi:MAG: hypothetical protein ACRBN8_19965 [Nannocystales bacterium]